MVIRPLDDRTYCGRSAFTHLGLRRKLYDCSLHHFIASQCLLKCVQLTFSSIASLLAGISKGEFPNPGLEVRGNVGSKNSIARPIGGFFVVFVLTDTDLHHYLLTPPTCLQSNLTYTFRLNFSSDSSMPSPPQWNHHLHRQSTLPRSSVLIDSVSV